MPTMLSVLVGMCSCLTYAQYPVSDKVQKGVWGYCQSRCVQIYLVLVDLKFPDLFGFAKVGVLVITMPFIV